MSIADLDGLIHDPNVELISLCSPRRCDQATDALRCLAANKRSRHAPPAADAGDADRVPRDRTVSPVAAIAHAGAFVATLELPAEQRNAASDRLPLAEAELDKAILRETARPN